MGPLRGESFLGSRRTSHRHFLGHLLMTVQSDECFRWRPPTADAGHRA